MTKALLVHQPGGPDALRWDDVDVGDPGRGEVRLRHTAIGVNFLDTFHRSAAGLFASYPAAVGIEGAGHIEAVGDGVAGFAVGDRVAYALSRGSYSQVRLIDAAALVRIPDGIADEESWKTALMSSNFVEPEGSKLQTQMTKARMLWDDKALYVFIEVSDTDINSPYKKRDDPLWKGDVVELFIDADRNGR